MIRPLRDYVAIKPLEYENAAGLLVVGIKLHKGIVVAVGPGRRMRRKVRYARIPGLEAGAIYKEDGAETGRVRPMRVKVGDCVEYGVRQQTEITLDGETLVLIPEQSIYGTTDADRSRGMLWTKSAGFDRAGDYIAAR